MSHVLADKPTGHISNSKKGEQFGDRAIPAQSLAASPVRIGKRTTTPTTPQKKTTLETNCCRSVNRELRCTKGHMQCTASSCISHWTLLSQRSHVSVESPTHSFTGRNTTRRRKGRFGSRGWYFLIHCRQSRATLFGFLGKTSYFKLCRLKLILNLKQKDQQEASFIHAGHLKSARACTASKNKVISAFMPTTSLPQIDLQTNQNMSNGQQSCRLQTDKNKVDAGLTVNPHKQQKQISNSQPGLLLKTQLTQHLHLNTEPSLNQLVLIGSPHILVTDSD